MHCRLDDIFYALGTQPFEGAFTKVGLPDTLVSLGRIHHIEIRAISPTPRSRRQIRTRPRRSFSISRCYCCGIHGSTWSFHSRTTENSPWITLKNHVRVYLSPNPLPRFDDRWLCACHPNGDRPQRQWRD